MTDDTDAFHELQRKILRNPPPEALADDPPQLGIDAALHRGIAVEHDRLYGTDVLDPEPPASTSVDRFGRLVGTVVAVVVLLAVCVVIAAGAIWGALWAIKWMWF